MASAQSTYMETVQRELSRLSTETELLDYMLRGSKSVNQNPYVKYDAVYKEIARELDFGYRQVVFKCHTKPITSTLTRFRRVRFSLVFYQDSIVYGSFLNDKHSTGTNTLHPFIQNKRHLHRYLKEHNSLYQTNFDIGDFHRAFNQLERYGVACGLAGASFSSMYTGNIQEYLAADDVQFMQSLLRDLSPEAQAYGMLGLIKNNHTTDGEDMAIIQYLLSKDTKINSCSGCTLGDTDVKSIYKEILSN